MHNTQGIIDNHMILVLQSHRHKQEGPNPPLPNLLNLNYFQFCYYLAGGFFLPQSHLHVQHSVSYSPHQNLHLHSKSLCPIIINQSTEMNSLPHKDSCCLASFDTALNSSSYATSIPPGLYHVPQFSISTTFNAINNKQLHFL